MYRTICALALAASATASAQTLEVEGALLRITDQSGERVVDVGCEGVGTLLAGRAAYVACGAEGVVRVDLDAGTIARHDLPAFALLAVDNAIWGRLADGTLTRLEADPIADAQPAPRRLPAPRPPVHDERPIGRVTRVEGGHALVQLDEGVRVAAGDTVEILRPHAAGALTLESERDDLVPVGRGVVEAASERAARVRLEVDVAARPEMWVRRAESAELLMLPPEPVGLATLSVRLRPFIPMNILGFGAINDLSVGYTTDFGLAVRLELTGFAFGFARRQFTDAEANPLMPVIHGYAGAVTRWFELGVGLGWSRSYRVRAEGMEFNEGFSVLTMARFGTEDGLSARLRFTLLVRDVWEVGDFYVDGRVPIAQGWWIVGGGGGGNTGVRYGEAGVRALVMGNGLGGSVFLHATIGVGMIEQGANFSNAGPMLGLGLDARL